MKKRFAVAISMLLLLAILSVFLVACNEPGDYVYRLEKAGYTIISNSQFDEAQWEEAGCRWIVEAYKQNDDVVERVTIIMCLDRNTAKRMADLFIEDLENPGMPYVYNPHTYVRGKLVIYGTKNGVEDAK